MHKGLRQNSIIDISDIDQEFWKRIEQQRQIHFESKSMAKPTVQSVKTQIDTHEAICAERWQETINRIKRLEMVIVGTGGATIVLLLNIVVGG